MIAFTNNKFMRKWLCSVFLALAFVSCDKTINKENEGFNVLLFNDKINSEDPIANVNVYALTDGVLASNYNNINSGTDGSYPVYLENSQNTVLFFLTNGDNMPLDEIAVGKTTSADMFSKTTPVVDYNLSHPIQFYTAVQDISVVKGSQIEVAVTRSLARLDLKIQPGIDVKIDSCRIANIVDRSYIYPTKDLSHPNAALISASLSGSVFTATSATPQNGFFYLYESENVGSKAIFYIKLNGVKNILEVALPARIERNKKYGITIGSHGATLFSTLVVLPWGTGSDSDAATPSLPPLIDDINSNFPSSVSISKTKDTLFIPSGGASGVLAINTSVYTELTTESNMQIEPVTATSKATYVGNKFRLTFAQRKMTDPLKYSRIYVNDKTGSDQNNRYIVVVEYPYRTSFLNLRKEGVIDYCTMNFDGYIDGAISDITFSTPISSITCETSNTADTDFNWLHIDKSNPDDIKLLGAFKPNDVNAKGQLQESTINVEYPDGLVEVFKFTRKRHTLPVVFIGKRYWTKYNMRGNTKKYEDQIGLSDEPGPEVDIFEYLKTCTSEQYLYYAGANYKGLSQDGMYLRKSAENTLLYPEYLNYDNASLSTLSPTYHCPGGYEIPNINDFGDIMSKSAKFGLPANGGSAGYNSTAIPSIRFKIERHKRDDVVVDSFPVTTGMYHAKITEESTGTSFIWAGTGYQWNYYQAAPSYWIYAMVNSGNNLYYSFNHGSNYSKVESHASGETRIVRCIKSRVSHII